MWNPFKRKPRTHYRCDAECINCRHLVRTTIPLGKARPKTVQMICSRCGVDGPHITYGSPSLVF